MALLCISDHQIQDRSRSSSLEEVGSIRIGRRAQQPAPTMTAVLYIGPARLMPRHLRSLCSCAGLFFARKVAQHGGRVDVEVAALSRYFDGDQKTLSQHIRTVAGLTEQQFAQLLEWDRHLAGMATCDVCELVEAHAMHTRCFQEPPALTKVSVATDTLEQRREVVASINQQAEQGMLGNALTCDSRGTTLGHDDLMDVDQVDFACESVMIPLVVIQSMVPAGSSRHLLGTSVHRLLLQAALRQLRREQQEEKNTKHRRILRDKERRLQRIFRLRGHVAIYQLIESVPIYERGKHGKMIAWRVDVDVPVAA